jgi:ABC-type multidrug transport system permease subunit
MQKTLWLFKASTIIVKIGAWLILVAGFFAAVIILLGFVKDSPRWIGIGVFLPYLLLSAFLMLVSEMAKAVMKISETIKKE